MIATSSQAASYFWNPITGGSGTLEHYFNVVEIDLDGRARHRVGSMPALMTPLSKAAPPATIAVDSGGISVHNITVGVATDTVANNYSFSGGTITLGTAPTLTVTNVADIATISSAISGSGFTKQGLGTLVLSGVQFQLERNCSYWIRQCK